MAAIKTDYTGKKIGKWTILNRAENVKGKVTWNALCDCGNSSLLYSGNIYSNQTKGCRECYKLPVGIGAFRGLLYHYKKAAQDRNLKWELSENDAKDLFVQDCQYCGSTPSQIAGGRLRPDGKLKGNGTFTYNGIDRVDNSKGYTKENCVTCCKKCNFMKLDLDVDDFLTHIALIIKNNKIKI